MAKELEHPPMDGLGPGFGHNIDWAAAVVAVLGIEVVGDDAKLRNGVQIRNNPSAVVLALFDVGAIHHEAVGRLALAVDRLVPGVQIAGNSAIRKAAKLFLNRFGEGTGNNSRLKRQQIGEGASVQGNGGNLRSTNHFAVLGAVGFDVDGFAHDRYFFGGLTDLELYVHAQSGVDVDHQTSLPVELESRRADLDVVGPDRQRGEIIEPLVIRGGLRLDTRLCFNGRHSCCDHDTAV